MEDFERELKLVFLDEAAQIVSETEQCFLMLESAPNDCQIIEKLFRLAHNLKGSSKAVGFDELGHLTHELESLLLKVRNHDIAISKEIVTLLLRCNDQVATMVCGLRDNLEARFNNDQLLADIRGAENLAAALPADIPAAEAFDESESSETYGAHERVESIEQHMQPAPLAPTIAVENEGGTKWGVFDTAPPAPVAAAPVATSFSAPTAEARAAAAPAKNSNATSDDSIRISLGRLEQLIDFVGEVVILQTVLREQVQFTNNPLLRKTVHQLGKVTKEVQDLSMSLRMVPLRQTFQKMQRIVRDTSGSLDKKVNLVLRGEDTELDKTILEKISDPLVHLIRNAVDHGIETPAERVAAGKPEHGTVLLSAYHQSGKIVVEVSDDGKGMNPANLRQKAIEKGILRPDQAISDRDAFNLIFKPGFSTKSVVTDVSGRGVGMDVVKTNIEALQGEVVLDSEAGKGSRIKIVLPLTLAIIDGLIVNLGTERYVLPLTHVHESVRPQKDDIHTTSGLGSVLSLRDENMPLYNLSLLLGRPSTIKNASDAIAIVVRVLEKPFAILVDDIHGQSEVVIKKLGNEHRNLVGVSGSAILGDGKAALILEVADLVRNRQNASAKSTRRVA